MPYKKYPLLNKKNLKTVLIKDRKSLVDVKNFTNPYMPGANFNSFIDSLPNYLAAKDLRQLAEIARTARKIDKPIILGTGAHTVKVGLGPLIIDLMERGWISAIAANGAFMIHDFEIALAGKTSEDVSGNLHQGQFGNTEETSLFLNVAMKAGIEKNIGAGEAVGRYLLEAQLPFNRFSILYNAYKFNIPVTIHPAIGTDFIHYSPNFNGAVAGELADRDFVLFASIVSQLSHGGVYLNIGSAVIMPEIFLKAVAFCTGQGIKMENFHTAVFDFIKQYRPTENVVKRPNQKGGKGFYFVGHNEIMLPLLAAMLVSPRGNVVI